MQHVFSKLRIVFVGAALLVVAGCATTPSENEPREPMGNFALGHNIVVVDNPQIGPFSREATDEEIQQAVMIGISDRFDPYEGEKLYNLAIKVDAYALAVPGLPLVFKPSSFLVINAIVWDDASGERLNAEAKQLTILEGISKNTLISSGLTQNKEKQLANLGVSAAKAVQKWLLENPEWIGMQQLPEDES